jgi:hypothetical protein
VKSVVLNGRRWEEGSINLLKRIDLPLFGRGVAPSPRGNEDDDG